MTIGMLWYDNSKTPLESKIKRAVEYYEKKYGAKPNSCLVNPKNFQEVQIEGLEVTGYRPVLPGHIWIGMKE